MKKKKHLEEAAHFVQSRAGGTIDCAIVLGSGFGGVLRDRIDTAAVSYKKIAGMPAPTVPGHAGEAFIGELHGRRVAAFSGRFHLYEGRSAMEVAYPIAVAAAAGARTIVLTNAAGAVNTDFNPGDLMLLCDHLNLTGTSPLIGAHPPFGIKDRFVDMLQAYSPELRDLARHMAGEYAIVMQTGVYAGLVGPAYETPAEARYLRTLGADAVGMSTVLETIAARALGCDVVAFSLITNVHNGMKTSHVDVLEAAARGADSVARLIEGIVANLDPVPGVALQSA
ncbi:MAG: purine-nucleoside phosphorylase [Candidatus Velthaea sp.]|jgi:purine-nucleoside phosphorylase